MHGCSGSQAASLHTDCSACCRLIRSALPSPPLVHALELGLWSPVYSLSTTPTTLQVRIEEELAFIDGSSIFGRIVAVGATWHHDASSGGLQWVGCSGWGQPAFRAGCACSRMAVQRRGCIARCFTTAAAPRASTHFIHSPTPTRRRGGRHPQPRSAPPQHLGAARRRCGTGGALPVQPGAHCHVAHQLCLPGALLSWVLQCVGWGAGEAGCAATLLSSVRRACFSWSWAPQAHGVDAQAITCLPPPWRRSCWTSSRSCRRPARVGAAVSG